VVVDAQLFRVSGRVTVGVGDGVGVGVCPNDVIMKANKTNAP
jgi:hypothetical protein